MLKRLTLKLFTLIVLCAALTTVSSTISPTSAFPICFNEVSATGGCVEICCGPGGLCWEQGPC